MTLSAPRVGYLLFEAPEGSLGDSHEGSEGSHTPEEAQVDTPIACRYRRRSSIPRPKVNLRVYVATAIHTPLFCKYSGSTPTPPLSTTQVPPEKELPGLPPLPRQRGLFGATDSHYKSLFMARPALSYSRDTSHPSKHHITSPTFPSVVIAG